MNVSIPEDLRESLLILLDGKYFKGYEKVENSNFKNLKENSILEDKIVVDILNKLYNIADFISVSSSVKNSPYKDIAQSLDKKMKDGIQPKEGNWDYELPESKEEFNQLLNQLNNVLELINIGDEVILYEKDRKRISNEVINSIKFANENNVELTDEQREQFIQIEKELTKQYEKRYPDNQIVENAIVKYNDIANSIWEKYLENPNHRIVHIGIINGEYGKNIMSTSLITENEVATFTYNGEGVGMLVKPKKILAADSKDVGTNNQSTYIKNANMKRVHLKLPQQIEQEIIDATIKANGENLNYLHNISNPVYSEVVLFEYEILGYVMIGYDDKSQDPDYLKLKRVAEKRGMEFKYININSLRKRQGLPPISTGKAQVSISKLGQETLREQENVEFLDKINSEHLTQLTKGDKII